MPPSRLPSVVCSVLAVLLLAVLCTPLARPRPALAQVAPQMTLTKSDGRETVGWNEQLVYDIVYTNIATDPGAVATNLVITDTLSFKTAYISCQVILPATGTCSYSGGVVVFTITGAVGPGESGTVRITVEALGENSGDIINEATLTYEDSEGNPQPPATGTDITTYGPSSSIDIFLSKDDGRDVVVGGDLLTYTITFESSSFSEGDAYDLVIEDRLPPNTTYVGCSSAVPLAVPCGESGGVVTFIVSDPLGPGQSGSVTVTVQVNNDASGQVVNNVQLTFIDEGEGSFPPVTASDTDLLLTTPGMVVAKDDGRTLAAPDDVLTYTITFANSPGGPNPGSAVGVSILDALPANVTFLSCTITPPFTGACSESAGAVRFSLEQQVAVGESGSVEVVVQVNSDARGSVVNSVELNYANENREPQPPATASDTDTIPPPDLWITISSSSNTVLAGQPITYTLSYGNAGGLEATGVVLSGLVPSNTTFSGAAINLAASTPGWSCANGAPGGSLCTFAVGAVAAGQQGQVLLVVNVADPLPAGATQLVYTATVSDDGTGGADPTPGNNTATAVVQAQPTAISLSYLRAERADGRVVVRWATTAADNTLGFHILRSADGRRASALRVTDALIPAAPNRQAEYAWIDATVGDETYSYWLQEVELNGTTAEYGPARLVAAPAAGSYRVLLPVMR